jgi:hypothetical protein
LSAFRSCRKCRDIYTTNRDWAEHMITKHDETSPLKCHFCEETFSANGKLTEHIKKLHSREISCQLPPSTSSERAQNSSGRSSQERNSANVETADDLEKIPLSQELSKALEMSDRKRKRKSTLLRNWKLKRVIPRSSTDNPRRSEVKKQGGRIKALEDKNAKVIKAISALTCATRQRVEELTHRIARLEYRTEGLRKWLDELARSNLTLSVKAHGLQAQSPWPAAENALAPRAAVHMDHLFYGQKDMKF